MDLGLFDVTFSSLCHSVVTFTSLCHSVVTFNNLCLFSSLKEQIKARLSKVTNTARGLIGRPVSDLQAHKQLNT